jgi:hypothetical protein
MKVNNICLYLFILSFSILSCNKNEFLDDKPSSNVFVPTTLEDFQQLLDNEVDLNVTPVLGELSADNYYISSSFWQSLSNKERNAYIWAPEIYNGDINIADWNSPYEQVFYANVVLDGLNKVVINPDNLQQWNTLKGSALFIRAYAFYNLAQVFALPYNSETATAPELGIPLKLTPNVDETVTRSTIEQTYAQILNDLLEAKDLLPAAVTSNLNRPNKPAAHAQLARVYLSMRQYPKAGAYADSSLQLFNTLIDYNTRDVSSSRPFDRNNVETMYQSKFVGSNVIKAARGECMIDTILYRQYDTNDLRRSLFFGSNTVGKMSFKGSYNGTAFGFTGLATDEMYLIRAECRARANDVSNAINDLNTLLTHRWKTGTFTPIAITNKDQALIKILIERRKEMPMRGVRWTDLRRLNLEGYNITPIRQLDSLQYKLPPNSKLYALSIPPDAISLGGYKQNDR